MKSIKSALKSIHRMNVKVLRLISPVLSLKYNYFVLNRKRLNLKNPKDFNEKIQWLKLKYRDDLIVKCTDKYEVREYVAQHINSEILNDLYYVYDSVDEINWDVLPEKFALKTTHGYGGNIICDSKDKLDINDAIEKLNVWMKTNYTKISGEWQYEKITPRILKLDFMDLNWNRLDLSKPAFVSETLPERPENLDT